jgi:predicted dehydrogenase
MNIGGGRILGEACHLIDLMIFFSGSLVEKVCMSALGNNPKQNTDNAIITLKFINGSQGVINYFANGNKAYSKERVEIHAQGKSIIIDNFRKLKCFGYSGKDFSKAQDKGHKEQFRRLAEHIEGGGKATLIPYEEIINNTRSTFAALQSLQTNSWIYVNN